MKYTPRRKEDHAKHCRVDSYAATVSQDGRWGKCRGRGGIVAPSERVILGGIGIGPAFLVRGHTKNTFNGWPVDGGEYGFGKDAVAVIGDRGSEIWFMTVVHHEAAHDMDAYVQQRLDLTRRWGLIRLRSTRTTTPATR